MDVTDVYLSLLPSLHSNIFQKIGTNVYNDLVFAFVLAAPAGPAAITLYSSLLLALAHKIPTFLFKCRLVLTPQYSCLYICRALIIRVSKHADD